MVKKLQYFFRTLLTLPIRLYQKLLSKALNAGCLYYPSCSEYTRQSIMKHGVSGILLGVTRVFRCHGTFFTGGSDPVPDKLTLRYIGDSYKRFWRYRKEHNHTHGEE